MVSKIYKEIWKARLNKIGKTFDSKGRVVKIKETPKTLDKNQEPPFLIWN